MRRKSWGALAGVLAALSLITAAVGGDQLPIKGEFATEFAMMSPPPVVTLVVQGEGQMSHLGKTQCLTLDETVDFTQNGKLTGNMTFVAANGDKLLATMDAVLTADLANNQVSYKGTLRFNGGTGRFKKATGTAALEGGASPIQGPTGLGWFSVDGKISSVGASKK